MKFDLKYGTGIKSVQIPEDAEVTLLQPETMPILESLSLSLNNALENPLGCDPLASQLQQKAQPKIAIAVPDETLSTPVKELLTIILKHIYKSLPKLEPDSVTIVIGGGLHSPPDAERQKHLIPKPIASGCNILVHDANYSLVKSFGSTSRGTPVRINAALADADFILVIGQIDPHQFVGFTGGSKGVVIGCGSPESIEHNHSLMLEKNSCVGLIEGNPVREDLNEAGRMIGIDFAVNVVLNPDKKVVRVLAGEPEAVLKQGAKTCTKLYGVKIKTKFDIVVASCGGKPKDIVLYQAQKGLNLSSHAVKKGGKILLLAACQHGIGDDVYFDYVCQFASPEAVLKDFKKMEFTMGAHKAYLFGRTLVDYDVAVFSDLDPAIMGQCHLRAADPSNIINEWVDGFEGIPKVAVIPYANTTYFYETKE
jgi:nickel-dependent lactate racemase